MGWKDTIQKDDDGATTAGGWRSTIAPDDTPKEPSTLDKVKDYAETHIVDQLPGLGAAAGGIAGGAAGSVPGALAGAGVGGYLGKATQNLYNHYMRPDMAPKTTEEAIAEPISAGALGAGLEGGGALAGKALESASSPISSRVSDFLAHRAENLKVKATGATGVQASKFKPGTGRFLLDNKIGGAFSDPTAIADSAGTAIEKSGQTIEDSLKPLDASGVTIDRNAIADKIKKRIAELSGDESQTDLKSKLSNIVQDIEGRVADHGPNVPISKGEEIKRGFQSKVNWKSPDIDNNANASVSDAYRTAVEDAANSADPGLGAQFKKAKEDYGYLAPVKEAADKRAFQLQQSPHGGLLDAAHTGVGASIGSAIGGPVGAAIGAPVGYAVKALRPRIASVGAHSADFLADAIRSSPELLGKYAAPLTQAAARGPGALQTVDKILQGDPDYKDTLDKIYLGSNKAGK